MLRARESHPPHTGVSNRERWPSCSPASRRARWSHSLSSARLLQRRSVAPRTDIPSRMTSRHNLLKK